MKVNELLTEAKSQIPADVLKKIVKDLKKPTEGRAHGYPIESKLSADGTKAVLVYQGGSVGSGGLKTNYMTTTATFDGDKWVFKGTTASDYKKAWAETMKNRHVPSIMKKHLGEGQLSEMAKRATMNDFYAAAKKKYGATAVKDIAWKDVVALARELDVTIPAAAHKNKTGRGRVNLVPDDHADAKAPTKEEPKGMSKAAKAADTEQSDREHIAARQKKEAAAAADKDFEAALREVKSAMRSGAAGYSTWEGPEKREQRWAGNVTHTWEMAVRDWGRWEGDDGSGDYDFQRLSKKSSDEMRKIIDAANKTWGKKGIDIDWQTGEKNWIYVSARAKK